MRSLNDKSFVRSVAIFEIKFVLIAFLLSLVYELAHSPLYIFVDAASTGRKLYFIVHCSFRDLTPFLLGYHLVAVMERKWLWIIESYRLRNIALFTLFAFGYTILSESYHVHILKSWGYKESMPYGTIVEDRFNAVSTIVDTNASCGKDYALLEKVIRMNKAEGHEVILCMEKI